MAEAYTSWKSAGGNNADHIGGNGYEFSYVDGAGQKKTLQVDYGSLFSNKAETGYDCFIPTMPGCDDILITHGHADHIGGIAHLMNLKREEFAAKRAKGENLTIHCTPFAEQMIKNGLSSTGIPKEEYPVFDIIEPGKPFEVNGFKVEPFAISHSIPDAVGFVIESPDGTRMMTTGDFKTARVPIGKGWEDETITQIAAKGVDYLFVDSTSAVQQGVTIGEAEVKDGIKEILKQSKGGPIISGVISSSCHRLHTVATALAEEALEKAAQHEKETGIPIVPQPRTMILDGASLIAARRALGNCGYKLEDLIKKETGVDIKIVASNTQTAKNVPPQDRFYVCTGTQGEDASLLKIAEGRNSNISLEEMRESSGLGKKLPIYVYNLQSCIPGSEEKHQALEEKFQKAGCTTYFPSRYKPNKYTVHASGHASAGDVAKLCQIVSENSDRPTMVVPIHGDPGQRRNVMKIAQDNGLNACIVPNMAEMKMSKDGRPVWEDSRKTEEWIGVNDANNDFRRPYFKYDKVELNVETKQRTKTGSYRYPKASKGQNRDGNKFIAARVAMKRTRS
ncbi:MAG: ribonuclease J [Alphaproteobacteria bacterium]|nr:ribonuclease J [Alphaproteobacteria bacterium]